MIHFLKFVIVGTIIFLVYENLDINSNNSSYESYGFSDYNYRPTIINIYKIDDTIISNSRNTQTYQSLTMNEEDIILDTISFIDN